MARHAVLLRSPSGQGGNLREGISAHGVPLVVERGGFYDSAEILDLLSLLQLLDNPCRTCGHRPCCGRRSRPVARETGADPPGGEGRAFLTALIMSTVHSFTVQSETAGKTAKFLERFSHWRKWQTNFAFGMSGTVLAETHYAEWLLARPRGAQRRANVERFSGARAEVRPVSAAGIVPVFEIRRGAARSRGGAGRSHRSRTKMPSG